MDYLTKRFDMIAERILENERLTADLDDEAAQVLLDWGLSSAKLIVDSTAGIEDEEEADEAMYTRLRANARLMRTVNKWVPKRQTMDELASLQEFGKVGQYVATVYAETFIAPSKPEWQAFLSSYQANSDVDMIVNLRNLFDHSARSLPADEPTPTDETPSEQLPTEQPTQISPPATDETPSEQLPTEELGQTGSPATDETPSEQVPADEPTQISSPAIDETPNESTTIEFKEKTSVGSDDFRGRGSEPPKTTEVVTTDEPSGDHALNNNNLSGQAPTRDPQKKINTNLQDSKPKSLVRRLWNWTTSFFRKR